MTTPSPRQPNALSEWFDVAIRMAYAICSTHAKGAHSLPEPDDIVQEVLPRFWNTLVSGNIRTNPGAYLERMIIRLCCKEHERAMKRRECIEAKAMNTCASVQCRDPSYIERLDDVDLLFSRLQLALTPVSQMILSFFRRNHLDIESPTHRRFAQHCLGVRAASLDKSLYRIKQKARALPLAHDGFPIVPRDVPVQRHLFDACHCGGSLQAPFMSLTEQTFADWNQVSRWQWIPTCLDNCKSLHMPLNSAAYNYQQRWWQELLGIPALLLQMHSRRPFFLPPL
jgi:hypothetical protein